MDHAFDIDFSSTTGTVKLFNSLNKAPMGHAMRLPKSFRELRAPLVRVHDMPFDTHGVVDISYLFPSFQLDPDDPANYRFRKTDDCLKTILDSGSGVYFRLGESIEHSAVKYVVNPPEDIRKWARICVNIVSHYRVGWAGGFDWPIEYWEIWNEPDMRPSCWTGTDEQYCDLYIAAAKAIKKEHPDVKVGGPATYSPFNREFLDRFLSRCAAEEAPLDFYSWHRYSSDPLELAKAARMAADMLAEHGFGLTENHCNEWNYFPDVKYWPAVTDPETPEVATRVFDEISGPKGAAYVAASIILAQQSPLDLAMYYCADSTRFGLFAGLFNRGIPQKNYHVFRAMNEFATASVRVSVRGNDESSGLAILTATTPARDEAVLLLSNFAHAADTVSLRMRDLPWPRAKAHIHLLDGMHSLDCVEDGRSFDATDPLVIGSVGSPSVCLIRLRPS